MPATGRSGGNRKVLGVDQFPRDGLPSRPSDFSKEENETWTMLMGQIPNALLRRVDTYQLQILAKCICRERQLSAAVTAAPENLPIHRAWLQTCQQMSRLSAQFGLSPVDRMKIKLPEEEEADENADFL